MSLPKRKKHEIDLVKVKCVCTTPNCANKTDAYVWPGSKPFKKRCYDCTRIMLDDWII